MRPRRLWVLVAALLAAGCCGAQVRDDRAIARCLRPGLWAALPLLHSGLLRYPQHNVWLVWNSHRTAQPSTS